MRVMSMHECYESVVLDRTVNRWFLRSDVLSWPQRAWISSGEEGGWSVVARDDRVTFGVRVVDSYSDASKSHSHRSTATNIATRCSTWPTIGMRDQPFAGCRGMRTSASSPLSRRPQ